MEASERTDDADRIRRDEDRRVLAERVALEYAADQEARTSLMRLVLSVSEEIGFGVRPLDLEDLRTLASTWSYLNDGETPSEAALRLLRD